MPETMAHVNCGNYDLVVIDESHIFRNKKTPRVGSEIRYERLMRKLIKEGVKICVLMLSSTPVNNRMADLVRQSMTPSLWTCTRPVILLFTHSAKLIED